MDRIVWTAGRGLGEDGQEFPSGHWHLMDPSARTGTVGTICGRWFPYGTQLWTEELPFDRLGQMWEDPETGYHKLGPEGWCWSCSNEFNRRVVKPALLRNRKCTGEMDFDSVEAAGLDGTGADGDPRFPYTWESLSTLEYMKATGKV